MGKRIRIVLGIILLLLGIYFLGKNREGLSSFKKCRKQGYTKEFCLKTPVVVGGPGLCRCWGGRIGRRIPGFRGECVCDGIYF